MSISAYDVVLLRLPTMEEKLSFLLNGIVIIRKERRHRPVMAEEYELMLNKVINTLRRCQDHVRETFGNADLSSLQLVVDGYVLKFCTVLSPRGIQKWFEELVSYHINATCYVETDIWIFE